MRRMKLLLTWVQYVYYLDSPGYDNNNNYDDNNNNNNKIKQNLFHIPAFKRSDIFMHKRKDKSINFLLILNQCWQHITFLTFFPPSLSHFQSIGSTFAEKSPAISILTYFCYLHFHPALVYLLNVSSNLVQPSGSGSSSWSLPFWLHLKLHFGYSILRHAHNMPVPLY